MTTLSRTTSPHTLTHAEVRRHFPALHASAPHASTVYLDNAGGSQVPDVVADAMHRYLTSTYVQLGADYDVSRASSATVARAHQFLKVLMNCPSHGLSQGASHGEVIIGGSTSTLCRMLADCYADSLAPGSEIIVCDTGHESNIGPWARLAKFGHTIKHWKVDPTTGHASLDDLKALLTTKTRIVAFPQVSNILGDIIDPAPIVKLAHAAGARVIVDGVAYAPHRAIDVAAWGCDFYVYSTYKVFGPHAAVMYASNDALAELTGPNHFFIPRTEWPRKFELGGANHESCAGILALDHYLRDITRTPRLNDLLDPANGFDRAVVTNAFDVMERLETPLQEQFMRWVTAQPQLRVVGPAHAHASRVCTISFVHKSKSSKQIAQAANARGFGLRFGNFYAYRLCQTLGFDTADGVVRVSLAHYNTHDEIDRLIACLQSLI
jgi:cysteine desulfurase family protein (TIGR01976 family)